MQDKSDISISRKDFRDEAFAERILTASVKGDSIAMEKIYIAYKQPLYNLAYRFANSRAEADDLLQEVFIKVLRNLHRLKKPGAFDAWVYRIAVNACISFSRKPKFFTEVYSDEGKTPMQSNSSDVQFRISLEQALRKLPAKQKAVFLLHDVEGASHREIAEIMKWTEGTSKSQLFKARMKLKRLLRGD